MKEKLKSLVYPRDCLKASIYCQIALRILEDDGIEENQEDLDLWLQDYDSLYWILTNQPPGLPAYSVQPVMVSAIRYCANFGGNMTG